MKVFIPTNGSMTAVAPKDLGKVSFITQYELPFNEMV